MSVLGARVAFTRTPENIGQNAIVAPSSGKEAKAEELVGPAILSSSSARTPFAPIDHARRPLGSSAAMPLRPTQPVSVEAKFDEMLKGYHQPAPPQARALSGTSALLQTLEAMPAEVRAAALSKHVQELSATLESSKIEWSKREALLRSERDDAQRRVATLECEARQLRQAIAARDVLLLQSQQQSRASSECAALRHKLAVCAASSVVEAMVSRAAELGEAARVSRAVQQTLSGGREMHCTDLARAVLPKPVAMLLGALRERSARLSEAIGLAEDAQFALDESDAARAATEERAKAARADAEARENALATDAELAQCGEKITWDESRRVRQCLDQTMAECDSLRAQLSLAEMRLAEVNQASFVPQQRHEIEAKYQLALGDVARLRAENDVLLERARRYARASSAGGEQQLKLQQQRAERYSQVLASAADELRALLQETRDKEPLLPLAAALGVPIR